MEGEVGIADMVMPGKSGIESLNQTRESLL